MSGQDKPLIGEQALQNQVGPRFSSDWKSGRHRERRLASEFIGLSGMTFLFLAGLQFWLNMAVLS